ncbi:MAG: HEAT repeat domain-containing protein, partial [Acidobacteriota bacterium]
IHFLSDLYEQLKRYLDEYGELGLDIEEEAFVLEGEKIHEDPNPQRSLPFFFFKDGMRTLSFCKGLEISELKGFLETIRIVSLLPPEEADIVDALWERDFPNIRYFAPDDFLETKIGVGKPPLEAKIDIDRENLNRGRIELTQEDLEEVLLAASQAAEPEEKEAPHVDESSAPLAASEERDLKEIESLLLFNRQSSAEEEYLNLVTEVLYLEDRSEQVSAIAGVVEHYSRELVKVKDFSKAALLLQTISDIRNLLLKKNQLKAGLVEDLLGRLIQKNALADLKDSLDLSSVPDVEGLFSYLRFFGPLAAQMVASLYESTKNPEWREKSLATLKEIARADHRALMELAQESRPDLTREIIALLGETRVHRLDAFLANFVGYKNPQIKLEAIRALAKIEEGAANKILLGFLLDPDEEVRTAAAENLRTSQDKHLVGQIIRIIGEKAFKKKSLREKRAFFLALGRSNSEEAFSFLRKIIRRPPFLPASGYRERGLCAAEALGIMHLPEARETLIKGAKSRHKNIREASLRALRGSTKEKSALPEETVR